jgi:hypothetical protein
MPTISHFSPKFAPMASDGVPEISMEQRETFADQIKEYLASRQTKAVSEQDVESDRESQSGESGDNKTTSNNSARVADQIWQGWKNQTTRFTILNYLVSTDFRIGTGHELNSKI